MPMQPRNGLLEIEAIGDATVANFTTRTILDGESIRVIGEELQNLGNEAGHLPVVLNFAEVNRLSSELVGKLIGLRRKMQSKGGRLLLCGIQPQVYEIFHVLNLPEYFDVYPSEEEALQAL